MRFRVFVSLFIILSYVAQSSVYEMLSCLVCEYTPLTGKVQDCDCGFNSVNIAASSFYAPILYNLTRTTFFKYFQVDMETPCSFWKENGMCMMEGCSVCTCAPEEIPSAWLKESRETTKDEYGWISPNQAMYWTHGAQDILEKVDYSHRKGCISTETPGSSSAHNLCSPSVVSHSKKSRLSWVHAEGGETYVNLLLNPERYTGYSGVPAWRVWTAIQQENCFGGQEDVCLEKRVFYRLMSGLQSSISTHIAMSYYYPPPVDKWDTNVPLFIKAVGSHPDRLNNLYFAFLVALRAAQKAKDLLLQFPIDSGNEENDVLAKVLLRQLLSSNYSTPNLDGNSISMTSGASAEDIKQCREGFDESGLFQVNSESWSSYDQLKEKNDLKEDFRMRFRNISLIMNCVSCERCRVWGKLQILGLGTAIKILLSNEEELVSIEDLLDRQEVIALVNTLHQLSKSVAFAAKAGDLEFGIKLQEAANGKIGRGLLALLSAVVVLFMLSVYFSSHGSRKNVSRV